MKFELSIRVNCYTDPYNVTISPSPDTASGNPFRGKITISQHGGKIREFNVQDPLTEPPTPFHRVTLQNKSPNKSYGSKVPGNKSQRYNLQIQEKREQTLVKIRDEYRAMCIALDDRNYQLDSQVAAMHMFSYGKEATGNYREYALLRDAELAKTLQPGETKDIVMLKDGDHFFNVKNQPKNKDESYPKNFSDWAEEAEIFDDWTNIHCPARDYPKKWQETLQKWTNRGLLIEGESPLCPVWRDAIQGEKISAIIN